jgi:AcrR family transcriptional regulator
MPLLTSLLAQLEPASILDETAGKQQHKSSQTRVALLEAAILCLAEIGYARATTELIARRAKLSRGAMLHHYATKRDLIESVIDYICYKRMKEFVDDIRRLTDEQRIEQQAGLEIYWQSYLSLDYQAFLELQIAARTDEELRACFEPKARRFDRLRSEASRLVFPEYHDDWSKLDIATDFCQATMQGLLLNRDILEPRSRRVAVRKLFSAAIYAFRTGALALDNHPESDILALDQPQQPPAPKRRARRKALPADPVIRRRSAK